MIVDVRWREGEPSREVAESLLTDLGPITRLCTRCGSGEHGRPRAEGVHVSISYAEGLVAVAWADVPVGIDVEVDGPDLPELGAFRVRRDWCRAEAILKAAGLGIVDGPEASAGIEATTRQLVLPGPWVGVVAVLGSQELTVRDAST